MSYHTIVTASRYVFPIVAGEIRDEGPLTVRAVLGTAFSIGGGAFLTAGHTIENALASEAAMVGWPDDETGRGVPLFEPELLEGYDLGVFRADPPHVERTRWVARELALLDPVRTVGHPNVAEVMQGRIRRMAFEGSIVTAYRADERLKLLSKRPRIYLVSFRCPVGLSGSPLWIRPVSEVAGVVVGNVAADLPVFKFEETLKEAGKPEEHLIQQEVAYFGVAVESAEIVKIPSRLLGGEIGGWLAKHGLLQ